MTAAIEIKPDVKVVESYPEVELASRQGDGLEVALLWSRDSGRVWVDVLHTHSGETLRIEADPARALEVYYHPFAF